MSTQHPDQHYIEAIRTGDTAVLRRLIAESYPPVERWICQNSGAPADAEDVFGDALEAVFRKLSQGATIELTARFSTYIFSICKKQWLKRLNKKKSGGGVSLHAPEVLSLETDEWMTALHDSETMNFLRKKLGQLAESCRQLLELCWSDERLSMEDIAVRMGFASAGYASKRKHQCIQILKKSIWEDPLADQYL
ncbi:MAG: sigma-70 family RNA polymerase sigma factor [Saprospirales bacterium]|nr:sigma-70 family RNA polymerase sigma factor [Saprospirales bacterium]